MNRTFHRLQVLSRSVLFVCLLGLVAARAQTGPTITQDLTNQTAVLGGGVSFTVAVSGTGPFFYQWQFNGANFQNIITSVAGNGSSSYSGDGFVATNASLYNPVCVAVDASGNLFIADSYNQRIREVSSNGIITTVAGNGFYSY
jgi:hypothetical protein